MLSNLHATFNLSKKTTGNATASAIFGGKSMG